MQHLPPPSLADPPRTTWLTIGRQHSTASICTMVALGLVWNNVGCCKVFNMPPSCEAASPGGSIGSIVPVSGLAKSMTQTARKAFNDRLPDVTGKAVEITPVRRGEARLTRVFQTSKPSLPPPPAPSSILHPSLLQPQHRKQNIFCFARNSTLCLVRNV